MTYLNFISNLPGSNELITLSSAFITCFITAILVVDSAINLVIKYNKYRIWYQMEDFRTNIQIYAKLQT